LTIEYMDNLTNIDGLSNLTFISGSLKITQNPNLINLDGLINITDIKEDIILINLSSIENLNGLTNVEWPDYLGMQDNQNLRDFCGLQTMLTNHTNGIFYYASNNYYNPTKQNIVDGNCSI
jgi:hypothetical protein